MLPLNGAMLTREVRMNAPFLWYSRPQSEIF